MNIDVRVAHQADLEGAKAGFVYEDLDRQATHEALAIEAYADMATDYPDMKVEVVELNESVTKILVRTYAA